MKISQSDIDYIIQIIDDSLWSKLRPYMSSNNVCDVSDEIEDEIKNKLREVIKFQK